MSAISGTRAGRSLGYATATISNTAANLPSIPAGAAYAVITLESAGGIRWRDDGTDPTATVGMPVVASSTLPYSGANIAALKLIRQTVDVVINVMYYDCP